MTIHIDGSMGEGGGQILRTALALAALLGKPVEIDHIRAHRQKPGLRPQHLMGVKALAEITAADVAAVRVGSTRLSFVPRTIKNGAYHFDIGTAGAVTMIIAAILPPLLFAAGPSRVVIKGGTHVPFSPPFHYLAEVFLPALAAMGGRVRVTMPRWGWYPEGGGEAVVEITPGPGLAAGQWPERGRLRHLELLCGLSRLPEHIAEREEQQVRRGLAAHNYEVRSRLANVPAAGSGNMVFLKAVYEKTTAGFSVLGRRGKPAEAVADEVCRAFLDFEQSRAAIDFHLADQLLLYMALARGASHYCTEKITSHLTTNIMVIEQFLPVRFQVEAATGQVSVTGQALRR